MLDTRLENKLGFDRIRESVANRCSTDYAASRVASEEFCTDAEQIRARLLPVDEMKLILMFEDSFPTNGYIDCIPFLTPLEKDGYNIDLLSLGKLRTMLETVRKLTAFFRNIKDGIYPTLKRLSASVAYFPEVSRRIDGILDKYGEVKDTASDALNAIRKSLREKENSLDRKSTRLNSSH